MRTAIVVLLLASWFQSPGTAELSGEPAPYHFTQAQTRYFMENHARWAAVDTYLRNPAATPWGIVVRDYERDFLIFEDARVRLHGIEVTNEPIAQEVRKAPFESPEFVEIGLP